METKYATFQSQSIIPRMLQLFQLFFEFNISDNVTCFLRLWGAKVKQSLQKARCVRVLLHIEYPNLARLFKTCNNSVWKD